MPIYEYACKACRHEFEEWQKMSDPPVKVCPACKARKVERLISQTSFHLKGGGWYSDLYASSKPADAGKSEGSKSEGSKSEGSKSEGSKSEGSKSEGSKSEGSKSEGSKSEGGKSEGGKSEGGKSEGGKSEGGQGGRSGGAAAPMSGSQESARRPRSEKKPAKKAEAA